MEKDTEELSKITYDDLPTEEEWLIIQNECDKLIEKDVKRVEI